MTQFKAQNVIRNGPVSISSAVPQKVILPQSDHSLSSSLNSSTAGSNLTGVSIQSSKHRSTKRRDVDDVPLTEGQHLQRFRRQFICECISLTVIVLAIVFISVTPFLVIPVWVIPNEYSNLIRDCLWVCISLSAVLLIFAALLGNVYWYYDTQKSKWKWFFHCGRGPFSYYWGDLIFGSDKDLLFEEDSDVQLGHHRHQIGHHHHRPAVLRV